jgi:formylglycine-generating enzyme required for sulfatase activity
MWYGGHDTSYTALVGGKLPNPWGLYDMHGNAGEWVLDWHGDITGNEAVNPFGPQTGSTRVVRSRVSSRMNLVSASECTSSSRFSYAPNMGTYYSPDYTTSLPAVGIRLGMPIQ